MSRAVKEWFGKDDDSKPPASVRARVFLRDKGKCYLSGRTIRPGDTWDLEHVTPLWLARPGENLNRETNLRPALKDPHKVKTASEATVRAKCDRMRNKHLGIHPKSKARIPSRPFSPSRTLSRGDGGLWDPSTKRRQRRPL